MSNPFLIFSWNAPFLPAFRGLLLKDAERGAIPLVISRSTWPGQYLRSMYLREAERGGDEPSRLLPRFMTLDEAVESWYAAAHGKGGRNWTEQFQITGDLPADDNDFRCEFAAPSGQQFEERGTVSEPDFLRGTVAFFCAESDLFHIFRRIFCKQSARGDGILRDSAAEGLVPKRNGLCRTAGGIRQQFSVDRECGAESGSERHAAGAGESASGSEG